MAGTENVGIPERRHPRAAASRRVGDWELPYEATYPAALECRRFLYFAILILIPWIGCIRSAPKPLATTVSPPAPAPPEIKKDTTLLHLVGVWESRGANGNHGQMIFSPDGILTFKGSLTFYNPARWELDEAHQELRLTLPEADNNRLQVFQMAVGDGVKQFNSTKKQITYSFNAEVWALQVAGWSYSKPDTPDSPARQELDPNQ